MQKLLGEEFSEAQRTIHQFHMQLAEIENAVAREVPEGRIMLLDATDILEQTTRIRDWFDRFYERARNDETWKDEF